MDMWIAGDDEQLAYRELVLNERALRSPQGMANQIRYALYSQLGVYAPWLIQTLV